MIELYSGTPGSGKGVHVAKVIYRRLRSGRTIISNIAVDLAKVSETVWSYYLRKIFPKMKARHKKIGEYVYLHSDELTVSFLTQYAKANHKKRKENQTLIIMDEIGTIFNPRLWDRADRFPWIDFMRLHRHLGYNMIMIAQNDRLVDRQIRSFIEYEIKHRCINRCGAFGAIIGLLAGGKMFIAIEMWYGLKIRTSFEYYMLNKRIANIYDTFEVFEVSDEKLASKGRAGGSPPRVSFDVSAKSSTSKPCTN